ncbi:MAG TPA: phosphatidate cytidylyltransferase [Flavobacterium sp.]|nr:phosphatidate cytidylyltransferase [Flavobacterium sp.]
MRETLTRSLSGLVYILLLIGATLYSIESFLLLFALFLIASTLEFCDLVNLHKPLPIIIAIAGYAIFAYFNDFTPLDNLLLTLAALFVSAQLLYLLFSNKRQQSDTQSKFVYLIGYIILPFIILAKIPFEDRVFAPKILIGIFLIIWTNDTFAYIVGKLIGKTKLYEKISPKKTVEGFAGGLLFAMIISYFIAVYLVAQPILTWIAISLICSIFGTLGDLIESKFKRIAGVKDSGKIMPGHGGILDRLDSVIFAAPFIFLFYQILNYA